MSEHVRPQLISLLLQCCKLRLGRPQMYYSWYGSIQKYCNNCKSIAIVHRDWMPAMCKLLSFASVIPAVSPYVLSMVVKWVNLTYRMAAVETKRCTCFILARYAHIIMPKRGSAFWINTRNDFIPRYIERVTSRKRNNHFGSRCEGWQWCSWWMESCWYTKVLFLE